MVNELLLWSSSMLLAYKMLASRRSVCSGVDSWVKKTWSIDDEVGGEAYYAVVSAEEYVALAWLDSRIAVELPYLISAE